MTEETICALASGAGRSGVAVIRVSGPVVSELVHALTKRSPPPERKAALRWIYSSSSDDAFKVDDALVLFMRGPASFTGEDVVEFHTHGGPAIVNAVLEACLTFSGVRLAEPGEFTRRAFENGKLDLTRAEAVGDLIDAETPAQLQQALKQYEGSFADACVRWRTKTIEALAAFDAAIDFPDEDDIPSGVDSRAYGLCKEVAKEIETVLADADIGMSIRDGFKVAIIGPPNAGKSSLLNVLAKRDAAIVSDLPGTTRDIVEIRLVLAGYLAWVSDTAGLRETDDSIESEGVKRARARAQESDLRIYMRAFDQPWPDLDDLNTGDFVVTNHLDRSTDQDRQNIEMENGEDVRCFEISVKNKIGVDELTNALANEIVSRMGSRPGALITRLRHKSYLEKSLVHLHEAIAAMERDVASDLAAEDVRMAAREIGRISGTIDVDDILDKIFSEFCLGK